MFLSGIFQASSPFTRPHHLHNNATTHKTQQLSSHFNAPHTQKASQWEQNIFTRCRAVTQNTAGLALLSTHTHRNSRRGSQHQIEAAFKVWCTWTRSVHITLLSNHTHTLTLGHTLTCSAACGSSCPCSGGTANWIFLGLLGSITTD